MLRSRPQILNLLKRLQREKGLTYVFISHDLGVVKYMCNHVAVMYLGKIVESADAESLFARPAHPYTRALLAARPSIHARDRAAIPRIRALGDRQSSVSSGGCSFASRCPLRMDRCDREVPKLRSINQSHYMSLVHLLGSDIPEIHRINTVEAKVRRMTSKTIADSMTVLDSMFQAFNRHDAGAVVNLMTEDCVFDTAAGPHLFGTRAMLLTCGHSRGV